MEYSKQNILSKYRELKARLRRKPIAAEFYYDAGLNRQDLNKVFGHDAYRTLQQLCGDTPYRAIVRRRYKEVPSN